MTLSDLSSIVGVISGLAVLGSLVYLSLQVRQTEQNQRALMNQGVINRATDIIMWASQPDIARVVAKMFSGETDFSNDETVQLSGYGRCLLVSLQDNYLQHKAGLVDQITLETSLMATRRMFSEPVMRSFYKRMSPSLAPELVAFIDAKVCDAPLAEPIDFAKQLKADLTELPR